MGRSLFVAFLESVTLLLLTAGAYGQTLGISVSYGKDFVVAVASTNEGAVPGAPLDPADTASNGGRTTGILWVNETASSGTGWGVRFGLENKDVTPTAVDVLKDAAYISAWAENTSPMIYKYNLTMRQRSYIKSIGGPNDRITHIASRSGTGQCGELVTVVRLGANSTFRQQNPSAPSLTVVMLDACNGNQLGNPVFLDGVKDDSGVQSVELPLDIAMAPDESAVYVGTIEARRNQLVTSVNGVLHRIDLAASTAIAQLLPIPDVLTLAVHATSDCVMVAVDSHPILYGREAEEDGVKVYRRHPVTLASLEWGTDKKLSSIDPAFSVSLPRREANALTKIVDVNYLASEKLIVLLLTTHETENTWNDVKDTTPPSVPAIRFLLSRYGSLKIPFSVRQANTNSLRPIFVFINEDAGIVRRVSDVQGAPSVRAILPSAPLPTNSSAVQLLPVNMALVGTSGRAYIVGTITEGATRRLLHAYLKVGEGSPSAPSPSPSPMNQRAVCIGRSSTDYDGKLLTDIVRHQSKLRFQMHPSRYVTTSMCKVMGFFSGRKCRMEVPMLCYSWAPHGGEVSSGSKRRGRLCATDGHIVKYSGKLQYMVEFCDWPKTDKCVRTQDVPWNFKGPCGTPILVAHDIAITQHAGDPERESALEAAEKECSLKESAKISWALNTL